MQRWTGVPIRLSSPDVSTDDARLVCTTLSSMDLSGGPMVERFEREWAARLSSRHAVAVSSGTAALHLATIAAGVGERDLVITSPFSFVASANVILYERALPVFVDIDPETLAIDPGQAAEAADAAVAGGAAVRPWLPPSERDRPVGSLKALLPIHVFGRTADLSRLIQTAARHDVPVIEDACEAVGASHGGRPAGSIGRAGAFGFYPNKQMTTGEGGMLVTDDDDWAVVSRSLRNQGRDNQSEWLAFNRLGYNYRLDELSAALGLAQLRRLDELLARRAVVAEMYRERLAGVDWLRLPAPAADASWFVYVVRVSGDLDRDGIIAGLDRLGVPARAYFPPIHLQPFYRERFGYREGMFPLAEAAGREVIALPFHNHLDEAQIDFICAALKVAAGRH